MDTVDLNIGDYAKFVLALFFVLSLIFIAMIAARKLGLGTPTLARGADRRLAICEFLNIDGKRKLVLVKRDQTEHLILLGPTSDVLIESGIKPPENAFTKALTEAAAVTASDTKEAETPGLPESLKSAFPEDKT